MGAAGSPPVCIGGRRRDAAQQREATERRATAGSMPAAFRPSSREGSPPPVGMVLTGLERRWPERKEEAAAVTEPQATARQVPLGSDL